MQQAITWANVDSDLYRHMASLGHNEFKAALSYKEKMGCDIKRAKVVITEPCRNRNYTSLIKLVFCVLRNRLAFTAVFPLYLGNRPLLPG